MIRYLLVVLLVFGCGAPDSGDQSYLPDSECACHVDTSCSRSCLCDPDCPDATYPYKRCSGGEGCPNGPCETNYCLVNCDDNWPCSEGFTCLALGIGSSCRKDCTTDNDCDLSGDPSYASLEGCCQPAGYCSIHVTCR